MWEHTKAAAAATALQNYCDKYSGCGS